MTGSTEGEERRLEGGKKPEKEKKRSGRRDGARPGLLMHSFSLSFALDGDRGGRFSGTGHETARCTASES